MDDRAGTCQKVSVIGDGVLMAVLVPPPVSQASSVLAEFCQRLRRSFVLRVCTTQQDWPVLWCPLRGRVNPLPEATGATGSQRPSP